MSAYVSVAVQHQIRSQFANCCAYCLTAEFLTATTFEFEHIIPLSAGGQTISANLALACPSCNRYKASRQDAIDVATGLSVSLFHPQQQAWHDHFAWSPDFTEILGLTAIGRATCTVLKMNRPPLQRVRKMWTKLGEHPPNI